MMKLEEKDEKTMTLKHIPKWSVCYRINWTHKCRHETRYSKIIATLPHFIPFQNNRLKLENAGQILNLAALYKH